MSVEQALPTAIVPLLGSSYGVMRPGQIITRGDTGPVTSRDWFEHNLRTYDLDPSFINTTTEVEEYETFWHHVRSGGAAFWLKEVESATHRGLLCGPLADGSQTSFPLPVVGGSSVTVFDDGAVQDSSAYTVHTAANLLSDNMASFETSTTGWDTWDSCTASRVTGLSQSGTACCKVDPTGTVATFGLRTNSGYWTSIDGDQAYTVVASIRGSGSSFQIGILYYNSSGASLPTGTPSSDRDWSGNQTCTADGWTQITHSKTSQATAASIEITIADMATSANTFYVDCIGVIPGDLERWHLPSLSPGVIEFGSAPAANSRITATATGYRLCRVRTERGGASWTFAYGTSVRPGRLSLVEDIEV